MKKIITLYSFLLCAILTHAQSYHWGISFGGINNDEITSLSVDNNGNVISTGSFYGTVDFDPGSGTNNISAANTNSPDIFIQKLDAAGNLVWVKSLSGTQASSGVSITTDASGNIYLMGKFTDSIDLDPGPGIFKVGSNGSIYEASFVAKYSPSGSFIWGRGISNGGARYFSKADMTVDKNNARLYIAYSFYVSGPPGSIIIDKMSTADGSVVWSKYIYIHSGGSNTAMEDGAIAVDTNNNVIISGSYRGNAILDPNGSTLSFSTSSRNAFVVKLDSNHSFIYAKQLGGDMSHAYDVSTDKNCNIFLVGRFGGTVDFDPGTGVQNNTAGSQFGTSMYMLKLTPAGAYSWVNTYGQGGNNYMLSVGTDAAGNVYATGRFESTVTFNPFPAKIFNSVNSSQDAFILKVDGQGVYEWAEQVAGAGYESGYSLSLNKTNGDFCVGGTFQSGSLALQYGSSGSPVLNSAGASDAFLYSAKACPAVDTSVSQTSITLSANAANASYQWINCMTMMGIPGATGKVFTPTVNGSYAVVVNNNGCSDTSGCHNVTGVNVSDVPVSSVSAFPNPTTGRLNIKTGETHATVHLTITSVLGHIISNDDYYNTDNIVTDIKAPAGLYFLFITMSDGKTTHTCIRKE